MIAPQPKICLSMIVKNEAAVITRCLASVRPVIGHWIIVDTGSTDGTQAIIRDFMHDIPGELHERPWVDFAHNRTEALRLSRGHGDYSLLIDADDTLVIDPGFSLPALDRDFYSLMIESPPMRWPLAQLFRNERAWRYAGVLHEFPVCEDHANPTGDLLPGLRILRGQDGNRRKDPDVFRRDAAILEQALRSEADPMLAARYRFYLAQSYRDGGEPEKALANYLIRANAGFWEQEVYVSLWEAAKLQEQLHHPIDHILATLRRANDTCASRAEALYGASRLCRLAGRHAEGFVFAQKGLQVPVPDDALFSSLWVYQYGLLDELAVNASWIGHHQECLEACHRLLREGLLPAGERPRVRANAQLARDRLADLLSQELPGEPA